MTKCKYCENVEIEWPENYQKGMKPLEVETHIEHTKERCNSFQNLSNWDVQKCRECGNVIYWNRNYKEYDKIKDLKICESCKIQ